MSIPLFMFIGLLAVLGFSSYIYWIQEEKEEAWRYEFTLLVLAKKPLWVNLEYIEQLAVYYTETDKHLGMTPTEAANIEINQFNRWQ